ncbi:MAG: DUF1653 domain-containing protein [Nanoarchaeota archaeon]
MIPTLVPEVLIGDLYRPIGRAKHTEEERIIQMYYNNKTGDILLQDVLIDGLLPRRWAGADKQRNTVLDTIFIPPPFQKTELLLTRWENFKSTSEHPMTYIMHGIGVDINRLERFVLYSPRYESGQQLLREQGVKCLARPEEMFFSDVERDGYKGPRFRRIG